MPSPFDRDPNEWRIRELARPMNVNPEFVKLLRSPRYVRREWAVATGEFGSRPLLALTESQLKAIEDAGER